MEYRNYLGYKVYKDGKVIGLKGNQLKPQKQNSSYFYYIENFKINCGKIVLNAFGLLSKKANQRVKHLDGNKLNNSLENLQWK